MFNYLRQEVLRPVVFVCLLVGSLMCSLEYSFVNLHPAIGRLGANSMGTIAPTAKKLWAMPPSRPHGNFVMSPLYTAKRYSENYECVIMKLIKVRRFQPENALKAFSGRAPPGPAGGAYSAPPGPLAGF